MSRLPGSSHSSADDPSRDLEPVPVSAAQLARNEASFREVNEAIEEGRREREGLVPFVCECGRLGCTAIVELTLREYEWVRADPRSFLVTPGHRSDIESLLREEARFWVVQKPDGLAGDIADQRDPRR